MYEEHFHLANAPFNQGPDPDGLYITEAIRDALAVLAYGVNRHKGFILLTGDVGTGKTTTLQVFMRWLQSRGASTALIFNPHLDPDDFLEQMGRDFGVEKGTESKGQWMVRFNNWLLDRYRDKAPVVLLVDEAQQLSEQVLEELRLLTNLETPTHKLLQIVLCGQPEIEEILARPSLRQVRQRINLVCRTSTFSEIQTAEYVTQRLRLCGAADEIAVFENEALREVHRITKGVPRLINAVCEQALIEAYCDGKPSVEAEMVVKVADQGDLALEESSLQDSDLELNGVQSIALHGSVVERIP
jgi:general secretion pathway protein A